MPTNTHKKKRIAFRICQNVALHMQDVHHRVMATLVAKSVLFSF